MWTHGDGSGPARLISLLEDLDAVQAAYVRAWKAWHARLKNGIRPKSRSRLYHTSAAVLRAHESKRVAGGIIASLSIPWGFSKPDDDLGGYHLVWPRDLVEIAGGFIAIGAHEHVRRVLRYLQVTQELDGHWSQNMWLDGTPYWHGIQMDETALPILLVDLAARHGVIDASWRESLWPMVRRGAAFLARNGTTLGVHVADLETPCLAIGERVDFTLYWPEAHRREGADFVVWVERPIDSTMAGQFIAVPVLDRVRDAVEDHVRPRELLSH